MWELRVMICIRYENEMDVGVIHNACENIVNMDRVCNEMNECV